MGCTDTVVNTDPDPNTNAIPWGAKPQTTHSLKLKRKGEGVLLLPASTNWLHCGGQGLSHLCQLLLAARSQLCSHLCPAVRNQPVRSPCFAASDLASLPNRLEPYSGPLLRCLTHSVQHTSFCLRPFLQPRQPQPLQDASLLVGDWLCPGSCSQAAMRASPFS